MGQVRTLAVLGGVLALGLGAAIFVASETAQAPDAKEPASASAAPPAVQTETPDAALARPRASRKGTASVVGEVKHTKGKAPVEGQEVQLLPEKGDAFAVKTDAHGAFTLSGIPHGGPYELRIAAAGCGTIHIPGIALDRGERRDVGTLWLDPAVHVDVEVRSWADAPVEGAEVAAFAVTMPENFDWSKAMAQMGQAPVPVAKARTDAAGKAVFAELATGRWTFTATKQGFARGGRTGVPVTSEVAPPVVRLYLGAGHSLTGHVFDSAKRPVSGAQVLAGPPNAGWDMSSAPLRARTLTDETGRYVLASLEAGDTLLMVGRPGGGIPSNVATLKIPNVKEFDIVLKGTATLRGIVKTKTDDKPVEGAIVRAWSWSNQGNGSSEATSGADGRYSLAVVEGNVGQVTAEKEGLVAAEESGRAGITVREGDTATRDILLQPGASVSGLVKGPDGPIAGAKVWIHTAGPMRQWQQKLGVADAEGRYTVTGVAPGKALVRAVAEGFYVKDFPENFWMLVQQNGPSPFKVDVTSGGAATKDVEMARGVAISGTVVGSDGPLAGVRVAQVQEPEAGVVTGEDGSFRLDGVKPGAAVNLLTVKDGYAPSPTNKPVNVAAESGATGVVLRMTRSGRVAGNVSSSDGSPIADAQVRVTPFFDGGDYRGMQGLWQVNSAGAAPVRPDGSYEAPIGGLGTGKFTVTVTALDRAPVTSEPVAIVDGQESYRVDLVIEGGRDLVGRVAAKQGGAGVPSALVSLQKRSGGSVGGSNFRSMSMGGMDSGQSVWAVTDADGSFSIPHLAPGTYDVGARADGFVPGRANVDLATSATVTVELEPELSIEGTVTMTDGTPVLGAQVSAQLEVAAAPPDRPERAMRATNMAGASGWTQTGSGGRFRLTGLPAGNYRINVTPDNQGDVNIRVKRTDPVAAGSTDVKIVVETGGTISGRVLDPQRQPAGGTMVFANPEPKDGKIVEGAQARNARTKDDGSFVLGGLVDGPYTVQVSSNFDGSASGYKPVSLPGTLPGAKDLVIVLEEGLAISGTLVDGDNKPLANTQLLFQNAQPERRELNVPAPGMFRNGNVMTDGSGNFTIGGLSAGDYTITIPEWNSGGAAGLVIENGDRIPAGSAGIQLRASKGLTITGTVLDEAGPAKGGSVSASPKSGGRSRRTQIGADGTFEVTGLAPGALYNLVASVGNHAPARQSDVPAGASGLRLLCAKGVDSTGTLTDENGNPLKGVRFALSTPDGMSFGGMTEETGAFRAQGLVEGATYELLAFVDGRTARKCGTLTGGASGVTLKVQPQ